MAGPARLVYRSARLRAVYQPAASDILVFSFNGGEFTDEGVRFFGDTYFAKRNIAAIGFVDSGSTWFPKPDMQEALQAIRAVVAADAYAKSITYGISMGAWGALKYSRMLGAHAALAFGPQWSINPSLVGRFDDRYERFYDPAIHTGMEIGADDLCPRNYIFFDPLFSPDVHHAAHLTRHPGVHQTMGTFLGHPGISFFTKTRLIDRILALAAQDTLDVAAFRRLIRAKRAGSSVYWMGRAEWLKRKNGLTRMPWLIRSYEAAHAASDLPPVHPDSLVPLVGLTRALLDAGQIEAAERHLETMWAMAQQGASHSELGQLFVRVGAAGRARVVSEQALLRRPKSLETRLELVRTLIDTGDLERANAEIDLVRARAHERPIIWRRLRVLYGRLGRREDVAAADAILGRMPPPTRTPAPGGARGGRAAVAADERP